MQEKSTLPPSVAEVATAIPVFVGYTDKATGRGDVSIQHVPIRITSMAEYVATFGGPFSEEFTVDENGFLKSNNPNPATSKKYFPDFILYQSLQLYFSNGGGACYVVSAGSFSDTSVKPKKEDFEAALAAIQKVDEITIIALTDAVSLKPATDYYGLCQTAISQCSLLKDRFLLVDLIKDDSLAKDIELLRDNIVGDIKYAAAYGPYLNTMIPRSYSDESVEVNYTDSSGATIKEKLINYINDKDKIDTALYHRVKSQLEKNYLVLPPSAAIAGAYAKTDSTRGVWKAPANVALIQVLGPVEAIDNEIQADMNIHTSGKSVNAIRAFTGKGTLIWGARTLAGNDNEWKYISVRRLFNMVEESLKKATQFAVFEPNTPFTWLKLKTMVESYLTNLWRQGALFGDSPDKAFFVHVGLGSTMTEDDINNGIMNIEIGLAAVRPAEFIVLTFSHKRLEA